MALLKAAFKTHEGACKRAAFENAMARSAFARGDTKRLYRFRVVEADPAMREQGFSWRIERRLDHARIMA